MRALRKLTLVGLLIAGLLYWQPWRGVAPAALPFDPAQADGQMLTLEGTVTNLYARVSHRGNPYFTFDLDTGAGGVRVFEFGTPPCPAGSHVTVAGVFHQVKQVSSYTFFNQVDATRVTCR